MIGNNIVIDGHSHFGNDYFHGNTDLYQYIDIMEKTKIDYSLLMPTPCPVKIINDNKNKYLGWYIHKNEILYYSEINNNISNPFKEVNYNYSELINLTGRNNLFFIPLVHPMLDSSEYLEQMIKDLDPIAFKIHGVGEGIDPKKIPNSFSKILRENDIPLIIHTDYDTGNQIFRYDTFLLRNLNRPEIWIDYLNTEKIKGVLNHGCALDIISLRKINKSKLIKVGLGPDLIIEHDVDRLKIDFSCRSKIKYLENLKQILNSEKIIFDIDFNWNINPTNSQMDIDYLKRVCETWPDYNDQKQIYGQNILEHFDKLNVKIKTKERRK